MELVSDSPLDWILLRRTRKSGRDNRFDSFRGE